MRTEAKEGKVHKPNQQRKHAKIGVLYKTAQYNENLLTVSKKLGTKETVPAAMRGPDGEITRPVHGYKADSETGVKEERKMAMKICNMEEERYHGR